MSQLDECKHCTLRGDIKSCRAAICSHHESWYAKHQQEYIDKLLMIAKRISNIFPKNHLGKDAAKLIKEIEGE